MRLDRLTLAVSLTLFAGACGPRVAVVMPTVEWLGPNERASISIASGPQKPSATPGRIQLVSAVNETVSFQLVLRSPGVSCAGLEIVAEEFQVQPESGDAAAPRIGSTWESPRALLYRAWPVTMERYPNWYLRLIGPCEPRTFYDALIPVTAPYHGQPFTLLPGEPLVLWGDVCIPPQARPGGYRSALLVRGPWKEPMRLLIELTVYDVYLHPNDLLPAHAEVTFEQIIASHGRTDPRNLRAALTEDEDARRAIESAMDQLHAHGLSPLTREVYPRLEQESDGRIVVDWSDYDRWCGPWIDGAAYEDGRRASGWPLPVDLRQPVPVRYDGLASASYAHVLKEYVAEVRRHFAARGWMDRAWVAFDLARGPNPQREEIEAFRRVCGLLLATDELIARERNNVTTMPTTMASSLPESMPASMPATMFAADSPLRIFSTLIPQSMTPFGWKDHRYEDVSELVDIWTTPSRYFHRATMTTQRSRGKQVWLPPDRPPYGASLAVEAPPTQPRALAWQAFLAEADALWIEGATDWPPRPFEEPIDGASGRGDSWLLYPGVLFGLREPVVSVRLKQLRAGLQDVQLLRLLASHGRRETANLLAGSLIKAFGTDACGDHFLDGVFGRWVSDGALWQLARDLLLEEAAMAVCDVGASPVDREANRSRWKEFLDATRGLELIPESARVTAVRRSERDSATDSSRQALTISHELAVRSDLRTSVQGELRLGPLPTGGRTLRGAAAFGPLDERDMARRPLSWELHGPLPCDLDGHFLQRVICDAGDRGETHADAVLSLVQAPTVERPIRVDGDLSDWTPAESNAVGDFRRFTFAAPAHDAVGRLISAATENGCTSACTPPRLPCPRRRLRPSAARSNTTT
jgi:hypothetical protein